MPHVPAERLQTFTVLIPAGTTAAAPQRTALEFLDGNVTDIEILVPPGPSGFVGFQVDYGGEQVIPNRGDPRITTDDELVRWPIRGYPTGSQWECVAHNTDIYDHSLYFRFYLQEFPTGQVIDVDPEPIPGPGQATEAGAIAELEAEGEPIDLGADVEPIPATIV